MLKRSLLFVAVATAPFMAVAEGTSPWLPIPQEVAISANYVYESGDSAFIGNRELAISMITGGGATDYDRKTTSFLVNYGLSDSIALDASIGYGDVEVGNADQDNGLADSTIGLSWRIVDEYLAESAPTVTLRGGLIIGGDYDGGRLAAVGNDENGYEVSLLLGKQVTDTLALNAEVGYQNRSGDVPDANFYRLGGSLSFTNGWSAALTYSSKKYSGNFNIGSPGFNPGRFQEVAAEEDNVKLTVGYAFAPNQGVALTFGQTVGDGRNVVNNDEVIGLSYTYSLF